MTRDVVVSGVGLVTPLGLGREATWSALLAGRSGIRPTERGLEAAVIDFSPNGARSRAGDFAVAAAVEAVRHAGLTSGDLARADVGCAIGQSKPLLHAHGAELDASMVLSSFTGWSLEAVVRDHLKLSGPTANVAAACATGVAAIETAAAWIASGRCDVALAGAAESSLTPFFRAGFAQMGVLAGGDDPRAVRPFDRDRAGFAMGEGAAVLVLESGTSCRARGGRAVARLAGTALRQSPHDALRFDADGRLISGLIRAACGDRRPSYVNAHGTGTVINDAAEARGLRRAFGDGAPGVVVGSTKASTGHLLGAAGAVEAAFCALAVRDGAAPPSLHVTAPDSLVDFTLAGGAADGATGRVTSALSLSYGFGGQMAAVLFEGA